MKDIFGSVLCCAAGWLIGSAISMLLFSNTPQVKVVTTEAVALLSEKQSFPALVKLTYKGVPFCSGTVISDTEVLTAAHCVASMSMLGLQLAENIEVQSLQKGDVVAVASVEVYGINPRADTAIVRGDFKLFKKAKVLASPADDILANNYKLATCGFPYQGQQVCYTLSGEHKLIDMVGFDVGQMYAGMSGGPVIDLNTGAVVAVNHAVADRRVLVAPIINLFEGLTTVEEMKETTQNVIYDNTFVVDMINKYSLKVK